MPQQIKDALTNLGKQTPSLFAMLAVVSAFLVYQERTSAREDLVAKQRIEQCHQVQESSIEVIGQLTEAMQTQAIAFKELSIRLESVIDD